MRICYDERDRRSPFAFLHPSGQEVLLAISLQVLKEHSFRFIVNCVNDSPRICRLSESPKERRCPSQDLSGILARWRTWVLAGRLPTVFRDPRTSPGYCTFAIRLPALCFGDRVLLN